MTTQTISARSRTLSRALREEASLSPVQAPAQTSPAQGVLPQKWTVFGEPTLRFGSVPEQHVKAAVGNGGSAPYRAYPRLIADRFRIEAEVASGGMGTIFRAIDEQTQQPVALKLLRSAPGLENVERFLREGTVLAQLHHRGIVSYIDHGLAEEGNPYLAMEWLTGEDLSRRLMRGILLPNEALLLLRRIAEALALLHRRGIVHRVPN